MKTKGYYDWLQETSRRKERAAEVEKHRVAEAMLVIGSSLIVVGVLSAYLLWKQHTDILLDFNYTKSIFKSARKYLYNGCSL